MKSTQVRFFLISLFFAFAVQLVHAQDDAPNIYPGLAASLIAQDVLVIDVRSAEEIEQTGVLANAQSIPHSQIDDIVSLIGEPSNRAVVLYCGSGRRASRVIDALRERGFGGGVNAGGYEDLAAALTRGG